LLFTSLSMNCSIAMIVLVYLPARRQTPSQAASGYM
jgi:cbb3-type cytochrome oxidase subunit 3